MIVDRGGWKLYGQRESVTADASDLLEPHLQNFVECVRTRAVPACSIEIGHVSSALCHLGNIAYRLGKSVNVNSVTGTPVDDGAAQMIAKSEYRAPWSLSPA
jgi:hypothetical protein